MAQQHAVGVQRALRVAGGAGGVDHHRRIVGRRVGGLEAIARQGQQIFIAVGVRRFALDGDPVAQVGDLVAHGIHRRQPLGRADQGDRRAVGQAVGEGVRPEQGEQRDRDRAQLVDGEMRLRRLEALRQQDADPVAGLNPQAHKRVRQAVGARTQILEADGAHAGIGPLDQRRRVRRLRRPAVAAGLRDVVARGHVPAEFAHQGVVAPDVGQHGARPPQTGSLLALVTGLAPGQGGWRDGCAVADGMRPSDSPPPMGGGARGGGCLDITGRGYLLSLSPLLPVQERGPNGSPQLAARARRRRPVRCSPPSGGAAFLTSGSGTDWRSLE